MDDSLTHITIFIFIAAIVIAGLMIGTSAISLNAPSEETCQGFNEGYPYWIHSTENLWCEYNETGWHFNKTHYKESWQNATLT